MFPDIAFVLSNLNWVSLIDIILVTLVFFWLLTLVQGTRAVQLLRGLIVLVVLAFMATILFNLTAFRWLIDQAIPALIIGIPVIFQPEIRRALERLGRTQGLVFRPRQSVQLENTLQTVALAANRLSKIPFGALIVLQRQTELQDIIETGVPLDSTVSEALLLSIFHANTALHDGAVVIHHNRIVAASCVLPLGKFDNEDQKLGTRHRASLGITEYADAIVVIVSEETGIISIAHDGRLIRNLDQTRLLRFLQAFFRPQLEERNTRFPWLRPKTEA